MTMPDQRANRILFAALWIATLLATLLLFRYQVVIAGAGGGSGGGGGITGDVQTVIHAYRLDRWTGEMVLYSGVQAVRTLAPVDPSAK
jgi:hypothetical protein